MGFKKTSEGRVFFQGVDSGANDGHANSQEAKPRPRAQNTEMSPPIAGAQKSSPQSQIQIITLLKTLNERLKLTQAERNKMAHELDAYRDLIEDLQDKSERNERAYLDLEQKISKGSSHDSEHAEILARDALRELEETRKLLTNLETKTNRADNGVSVLKKLQQEQAEKMAVSINHAAALTKRMKDTETRQEQIGIRVEDAVSQQARLTRKIDKAIEERARFMRKLERIEETVLQTKESLNAKAMVLLTDQGVAAQSDMSHAEPEAFGAATQAQTLRQDNRVQNSRLLQIAGVSLLVVAALLGGWLISETRTSDAVSYNRVDVAQISPATSPVTSPVTSGVSVPLEKPTDMAAMDWSVDHDTSAFNRQIAGAQQADQTANISAAAQLANDDIGTLDLNDQAQVEALLSDNPQAVAAALNAIEPANTLPDNIIPAQRVAEAPPLAPVEEKPVQIQKPEPQKVSAIVKDPAPARLTPKDPKSLIKLDSKLPDTIKSIEEQAFNGVPEAQHDLAAIYTAGHGGVKQDYKRAAFWFEQAASRDVANAAYNLGVLNHQGLGSKPDLEKAIQWYKHAASLDHPEAQYNLGIAYIEGIGVPYDAQKASVYFTKAAENNIMEAAYNLGLIYENGLLGSAEPDKALMWYKTAADQGSPEAKQALEQLAQSLDVSLDDVNSLADSMKGAKKTNNITAQSSQAKEASFGAVSGEQVVIAQIQEYLMRMGLYPGPADGVKGPLTQDSIRSYQRLHNLSADGRASQNLLSHMLANVIDDNNLGQGSRER